MNRLLVTAISKIRANGASIASLGNCAIALVKYTFKAPVHNDELRDASLGFGEHIMPG